MLGHRPITIPTVDSIKIDVDQTIKAWTGQGKPVLFQFDVNSGNNLNGVLEEINDKVKGKVLIVRIYLMTSIFKVFGVKHSPAFVACWGDKKLKKIENPNREEYPPNDMNWWDNNKDEVSAMVDKLESKIK